MNQASGVLHFSNWWVGATLTVLCLAIAGCSSSTSNNSGSGGGTNPPTQLIAPTISPGTGTYSSAQTVTVMGAAGTTVHCTTDGTSPTASSAACPSTMLSSNGTTVFKAYVTEAGNYTDSPVATATVIISLPAPQTLSFSGPINMSWSSATMALPGLIASSSCPPAAVTVTVATQDSTNAVVAGAQLAFWTADSTNTTYGTLHRGNTFSQNRYNVYNVVATCGAVSANTTLTIQDPSPTISSLSPSIVKPNGSLGIDVYGTGFIGGDNSAGTQYGWQGTVAAISNGTCPTTQPTLVGGTAWYSDTHIAIGGSGGYGPGSWNLSLINQPTFANIGGGWTCTNNAFGILSNRTLISGYGSYVAGLQYQLGSGAMSIWKNASATVMPHTGTFFNSIALTSSSAFVSYPFFNQVIIYDLNTVTSAGAGTTITLTGYVPDFLATDTNQNVYAAATLSSDSTKGQIFKITSAGSTPIVAANGYSAFAGTGTHLLWLSGASASSTTLSNYDINAGTTQTISVGGLMDSFATLSNGLVLIYQATSSTATVFDPVASQVKGTVTFPSGLLMFSGDYVVLADGSIGLTSIAVSSLTPQLTYTSQSSQALSDLFSGFYIQNISGSKTLYFLRTVGTDASLIARSYP